MKINGDISDDEIQELVLNHKLTIGRVNKAVEELYLTEFKPVYSTVPFHSFTSANKGKTIKQWLREGLKGKTLAAALKNSQDNGLANESCLSLKEAIGGGFRFDRTIEGRDFWKRVHSLALNNLCLCEDNINRTEKVKQHKCRVCGKQVKL